MRSGRFVAASLAAALAAACYSFSGGGGFPDWVRTVYIAPFENNTVHLDLGDQLYAKMTENLPRALGVRPAGE
ncbi:MAG TPA: hypothetical protein VNK41_10370, partial [Vicinamibacterales bacterium]|nr:hypothetical protein [Vicinamibacterales bacterium]